MSEVVDPLAELYMFRLVEREHLRSLVQMAPTVTYADGDTVYREGAPADTALLVVTGKLVASVVPGGKHWVLGDGRPGDIVGETALFTRGGHRNATVVSEGTTVCVELSRKTLKGASRNPALIALERHMLGAMARRIRSTNTSLKKAWKEVDPASDSSGEASGSAFRRRFRALFGGQG